MTAFGKPTYTRAEVDAKIAAGLATIDTSDLAKLDGSRPFTGPLQAPALHNAGLPLTLGATNTPSGVSGDVVAVAKPLRVVTDQQQAARVFSTAEYVEFIVGNDTTHQVGLTWAADTAYLDTASRQYPIRLNDRFIVGGGSNGVTSTVPLYATQGATVTGGRLQLDSTYTGNTKLDLYEHEPNRYGFGLTAETVEYRTTTRHRWTRGDAASQTQSMLLDGDNLAVTGAGTFGGLVKSTGSAAGLEFADRTDASDPYQWYANNGYARLFAWPALGEVLKIHGATGRMLVGYPQPADDPTAALNVNGNIAQLIPSSAPVTATGGFKAWRDEAAHTLNFDWVESDTTLRRKTLASDA